ncbi:methyl-accepting chemotaxis protein [Ornithinibacillus halophilus]|uniref:Methyl-accepting chemotaxis protein n=1 Tax=Ornithinibacillus halophilus TaxID=930117 RepID=A0A1M5H282_9BACI|nr:methyl-accepting chemotaxis protein [Ornithinibacillus halophilus]SHG10045.1 methyl-accepting chemotaxis protein [Ornithinibacillus halophilus]
MKNKKKKAKGLKEKKRFNLKDVKIGHGFLAIFIASSILFLIAGSIVYFELHNASNDIEIIDEYSANVNDMAEMASIIQVKDVQISDYLLNDRTKYVDAFIEYQEEFNALLTKIEPNMRTNEQKELFNKIKENDQKINDMFLNEISNFVETNQLHLANLMRNQSSELRSSTVNLVNDLMDTVKEEQVQAVQNSKQSISRTTVFLVVSTAIAILLGLILMYMTSRRVTRNLQQVVQITTEFSKGNLQVESMKYSGNDEIGQLARAVNLVKENMKNILMKVSDASETVSLRSEGLSQSAIEVREGNEQIASTMQELSSGAETQANSTSSLSENMNDFVQMVRSSEQQGQEVANTSDHVLTLTNDGQSLMEKSVSQMKQIDQIVSNSVLKVQGLEQQSNEISKLISVIKDIADQTNLLSLNAAIEAARAGEQGKGFAVVADEVRKLSDQVSDSVGEITTIVRNIQLETNDVVSSLNNGYDEVKEGTTQIETTGENFASIHQSVSDMVVKINSISTNLKDIANNSNDMNKIIEEIASVSEESAAGVEQAAASAQQTSSSMEEVTNNAEELAKLAEQLNEELKVFKL